MSINYSGNYPINGRDGYWWINMTPGKLKTFNMTMGDSEGNAGPLTLTGVYTSSGHDLDGIYAGDSLEMYTNKEACILWGSVCTLICRVRNNH